MHFDKILRKLAKSSYWQNVFSASKANNGMHLFDNISNFSGLQIRFVYWLNVYSHLYEKLDTFESPYLTENVIKDDIRTDAFLVYDRKMNEHNWKKYRQEERNSKKKRNKKHSNGKSIPIEVDLRSE